MNIKQSANSILQKMQYNAGFKYLLLTIIALLVFTYVWVESNENYKQKLINEQHHVVEDELRAYHTSLTDALNQRFVMLNGLETYTKTRLNDGSDFSDFNFYAAVVNSTIPGIRNLIIAPGGINRYVYPLAGNEVALNHDLINDERLDVREDVQKAIRTGKATISGPYELRQKGQGIVLRKAIFGQAGFWGLVTIAVDMAPIYAVAGLTNSSATMAIAIRNNHGIFYGQENVFAAEPVIQTVLLPNGYFEIAAIPIGGWEQSINKQLINFRVVTLLIMILLLIIIYLVSYRNSKIIALVNYKTRELKYLSMYDHLTGLYNRAYFEEELKNYDIEENLPITLVIADINGLKLINDAFGYKAGDNLLRKVSEIFKRELAADTVIARNGGDEFVIMLGKMKTKEAENIINSIKEKIASVKEEAINLSISFGCETKNEVTEDINETLIKAENNMYRQKLFECPSMRGETINAILNTLHEKNKREERHSQRVSKICEAMGEALRMTAKEINELKTVGLLHDIGKVAIEEAILNKSGKLSEQEWLEIKRHPEIGYRILSSVKDMSDLAEYVLAHHERWDGKGYPKGLQGEEIPLQARIIALADAYDAMTSERAYRDALPEKAAIEELQKCAGTQFDERLTRIFVNKVLNKEGQSFRIS